MDQNTVGLVERMGMAASGWDSARSYWAETVCACPSCMDKRMSISAKQQADISSTELMQLLEKHKAETEALRRQLKRRDDLITGLRAALKDAHDRLDAMEAKQMSDAKAEADLAQAQASQAKGGLYIGNYNRGYERAQLGAFS